MEKIIQEEIEVVKGFSKVSDILLKPKGDKDIKGWISHVINDRIRYFLRY